MGKATRWLKSLFTGKSSSEGRRKWAFAWSSKSKEKSGVLFKEVTRSYDGGDRSLPAGVGDGDEQNRRAIAMAAATAAVAEAAVAAAQAAAVVVRLTSSGRACGAAAGRRCEIWAAVKIQSAFRGYLARRALKALKGLVKLQALARGHIVRKQIAEELRCMQALVQVQARARASRILADSYRDTGDSRILHPGHPVPRKCECSNRANRSKSDRSRTPMRNATRVNNGGLNLFENWTDERCSDSQETMVDDEKNDKILEIDPGKPHYNSKRRNRHHSMSMSSDQNSRSFMTMPDSPSKDSTTIAQRSIPSPSSVDMQQHSTSPLRFPLDGVELHENPHYYSSTSIAGSTRGGPVTPSKSECSRSIFGSYSGCPNYMAYTESSRAKARSQSAPKQRPEFDKTWSTKRPSPGQGSGGSALAGCLSSSSSQGSSLHLKFTGKAYPGSGRLDRLGMPIRVQMFN